MQEDTRILTASGDQTVALWDTNSAQRLGNFMGHTASVKSVSPWPACHDVFASGGRDGRICLWDSREPANYPDCTRFPGAHHAPVMSMRVRTAPGSLKRPPTKCCPSYQHVAFNGHPCAWFTSFADPPTLDCTHPRLKRSPT